MSHVTSIHVASLEILEKIIQKLLNTFGICSSKFLKIHGFCFESVEIRATNFSKMFFKHIWFKVNSSPAKIHSVHTYEVV